MKRHCHNITLSAFALILSTVGFAQDFQGQAYYFSKTTIDMGNFGGREMSEDRKKEIAERMKSMFEKTFVLTFNKEESLYKEEETLEAPGGGRGGMRFMGAGIGGGNQYKNVKTNKLMQEQEFFGKQFLINDDLPKLEWVMTGETKQIGKYLCMKATAVKQLDGSDFMNARRRNRDNDKEEKETDSTKTNNPIDNIEIPKEVTITAWYTPQIPINQGPGEYWGLPGLILEVSSDRTTILCSKIVMNPGEKEAIKVPSKGKEVTQEEYAEIVKKKMEEMREMYGGRNRRNGVRIRGN
ncbi:MAG: GLPGLI family protein [Flavobacteriaceae bacterium]|nr:GLPGLI family protein [Flavobacteriaceae bacterium]